MIVAVPAITLLVAVVAVTGTFLLWRAGRASEVERLAADCASFLGEVIARGGVIPDRYLTEKRQRVARELDHLAPRLRDRKLRRLLRSALVEYRKAFALSSPLSTRVDEIERARAAQHDAACKALDAFEAVLARVHELDRWTMSRG